MSILNHKNFNTISFDTIAKIKGLDCARNMFLVFKGMVSNDLMIFFQLTLLLCSGFFFSFCLFLKAVGFLLKKSTVMFFHRFSREKNERNKNPLISSQFTEENLHLFIDCSLNVHPTGRTLFDRFF